MFEIIFGEPHERTIREEKGKSLISFPENYTVIDIETTGLDSKYDEIIEISALRVIAENESNCYSSLVKPRGEVDEYIEELTGITNEMLESAPPIEKVLPEVAEYLGTDILVGHNVNFDINFLYDEFERILKAPLKNDFIDTMRISRKLFPELKHHRLCDISAALKIEQEGAHRALADCKTTNKCLQLMKEKVLESGTIDDFVAKFNNRKSYDLRKIAAESDDFDETHPLFGMHCVFTGTLEKMTRTEAAQIVVNLGGICDNSITKKTNFLVLGANDYTRIKENKSNKQRKAEEYKLNGADIEIVPEGVFYDMINF